ncbi:hypothetical protein V8E53_000187 [Lactarius tabidus]
MVHARARPLSSTAATPVLDMARRRLSHVRVTEVLDGLRGAPDSHEFVFGRLISVGGCRSGSRPRQIAPSEKENRVGGAETKTENAEVVTNLDTHRTASDAALPPGTVLVLFSGHSNSHSIFTLAARRVGYQAGYQRNQVARRRRREMRAVRCDGAW